MAVENLHAENCIWPCCPSCFIGTTPALHFTARDYQPDVDYEPEPALCSTQTHTELDFAAQGRWTMT